MRVVRRLDHVAILVRSTDEALTHFRDRLGLRVVWSEENSAARVRLTYLDCGDAFVQLVEPTHPDTDLSLELAANGEGVHHVCFGVDDVLAAVEALGGTPPDQLGTGRGRASAFVPGPRCGVLLECTEFSRDEDVRQTDGWLA